MKVKIFVSVIAFLILTSGVVYRVVNDYNKTGSEKRPDVLSENVEDVDPSNEAGEKQDGAVSSIEADSEGTNNSGQTISNDQLDTTNIKMFIYPSSEIKLSSEYSVELVSDDDVEVITQWYKDKIESLDINVKSFVTTKSNNNILNKLVGSNQNIEVRVDISKSPESNITSMTVESIVNSID